MTPPPLNESTLKALESLLKFEQVQALIQDHLTGSRQKLAKMQACVQQHNWAEVGRIAHDVVSTSANFGMEAVLAPARRLEAACLADNPAAALAELANLQTLLPAQLNLLAQRYNLSERMTAPPSL